MGVAKASLSKAKIKLIHALRLPKYRKQHQLFVAEGSINVLDFLQSRLTAAAVFATADWLAAHAGEVAGTETVEVDMAQLKKITALSSPSEVLALFHMPEFNLPDLTACAPLLLLLDGIKDPGNMGTIIRTADWFGCSNILCSPESVDVYGPKVVQASMGSLARVRVGTADLAAFLKDKADDWVSFGAFLDGEPVQQVAKPEKSMVVIGSEAHGISPALAPYIDRKITIPSMKASGAESLNASIAAGIICYEFRR